MRFILVNNLKVIGYWLSVNGYWLLVIEAISLSSPAGARAW
jgi:hypothetical protein